MSCLNPRCLGNYDFDQIVSIAKKRFIEGHDTIELMQSAVSELDKHIIALVSLLSVEDDNIQDLKLSCKCAGGCKTIDYRDKLKKMLELEAA